MIYVPVMRTNPPDELTLVAAEFHEVWQRTAPKHGQPESGILWQDMPLNYQQCLREVLQVLFDRETIKRNYWR